jgi:glycosyltransferase involved in cell wall biosynthesis
VTRNLKKNLLIQIFKYIEFTIRVAFYYRNQDIGMINIHSLALLPLGCLLKFFYGAKLIYDAHELETETNGARGLRKKLAKIVERLLIQKPDHIFVVSENIADWYHHAYPISRPTVVLNAPKLCTQSSSSQFRDRLGITQEQVIFLYQGILAKGRGVELLLSAFENRANNQAVIVFMGYGPLDESIKQVANRSNQVFFHPAVASDVVLNYTASADVGIALIENTCLSYYYCMPNKLFEYAMVGLPVVVSNMKEMREMVERYNMGVVIQDCNDGVVESINQAIDELIAMDLTNLKRNARQAAEENAWEFQEKRMLEAYRTMGLAGEI